VSKATLVVLDANVITLDSKKPEAEAFFVRNGKIVAVGSSEEISKHVGNNTKVILGKGRTVVPGFIDCHAHMAAFGLFLQRLDLRGVKSIAEIRERLRDYEDQNIRTTWILGGRWDQEKLVEKRYPTRWDLDEAVADKPVFLERVCGHIGVANSKALQLAHLTQGITIDGGALDIDSKTGLLNGIVRENAIALVRKAIPKRNLKELKAACVLACQKAAEVGLTGVHWLVESADELRVLKELYAEEQLPLRVYLGISVELLNELVNLGLLTGFGSDMVRIGFVKILADGSLGARTAALKKPYSDKPESSGMMLYSQRKLNQLVLKAHVAELQVAVHAIGDCAIHNVLDVFEKVLELHPRVDHRHRVEHCSVLDPSLIERMKRLGVVVSVQPFFLVSDFWTVSRVGKERACWIHPFRTLFDEGLVVASGSDCPVATIDPLKGIWAAVSRKGSTQESLTVQQALKTYTLNAAYASFEENIRGTIEAGKLADFTVLSDSLFSMTPDEIRNVVVDMTVVGGKVVYRR
jgi:predicted amidohydrolase YtcJ